MKKLLKKYDRVLESFLTLLVIVMLLDVSLQVFARKVLHASPSWTEELARFLLMWIGIMGCPVAINKGAHIGILTAVRKLKQEHQIIAENIVNNVIIFFSLVILLYGGIVLIGRPLIANQLSPGLQFQFKYIYLALPLAGIFNTINAARLLKSTSRANSSAKGSVLVSALILLFTFVILIIISTPIAFSIGVSTFLASIWEAYPVSVAASAVAHKTIQALNSFPLLAVPFFILSGQLMGHGGIARRLIDLANVVVGRFRGGLGYVNVLACMFFGAISGSAMASVSSIGPPLVPIMEDEGYEKNFSAALTMAGATTGLIIPPSNIMIIYSVVASVSVASLFLAGFLPGIIIGLGLMTVVFITAHRKGYKKHGGVGLVESLLRFKQAILSLLLVVIVLGGILGGYFTATEASAVAVVYSLILTVIIYRAVKLHDLPKIFLQCGVTTAFVMFLIGTSKSMGWIMTDLHIPETISGALIGFTTNKYLILLIINVILLSVGIFMDMTPALLIFTPIFLPVALEIGIHPIHFGLIMITNLCIGLVTPPVGTVLFVGCAATGTTIPGVTRPLIKFWISMVAALMVISYIPQNIILFLPKLFGFL